MSELIYITVGLSKRCCHSRLITHFSSMPLNKVSISRLLSKMRYFLSVSEETSIEQSVSEINVHRKGSIAIQKDSFIFGILPGATFLLGVYMQDVINR